MTTDEKLCDHCFAGLHGDCADADCTCECNAAIIVGTRVRSSDYGAGTVVMDLGGCLQVVWDEPLIGTPDHRMLLHDRAYVEKLERLTP